MVVHRHEDVAGMNETDPVDVTETAQAAVAAQKDPVDVVQQKAAAAHTDEVWVVEPTA